MDRNAYGQTPAQYWSRKLDSLNRSCQKARERPTYPETDQMRRNWRTAEYQLLLALQNEDKNQ